MPNDEALKPCPFCGETPVATVFEHEDMLTGAVSELLQIMCNNGCATFENKDHAQTRAAWNHRPGFDWQKQYEMTKESRDYWNAAAIKENDAWVREHARVLDLLNALKRLRTSAALLQQNAEDCAVNHYAHDFEQQGLPGWLVNTKADIEHAAAVAAAQT